MILTKKPPGMYIYLDSLLISAVAAFFASFITSLVNFFMYEKHFYFLLFIAIFFDIFFGVWKHLKCNTFSFKKLLIGLMEKIWFTIGVLVVFLVLKGVIELDGASIGNTFGYIFMLTPRLFIVFYPLISIVENIHILSDGKLPPVSIMKRFEKFSKTYKIKDLNDGI